MAVLTGETRHPGLFDEAERLFRAENIQVLGSTPQGRRYLKLRSLSRREYLTALLDQSGYSLDERPTGRALFRYVYESVVQEADIDKFIDARYREERKERKEKEASLVNELYKMEVFDWGGLHQNSLEKTIVDNYVKKIITYDALEQAIEGDLHTSMRGYVLCSWYNHWTSILIEDLFRDHPSVVPALGQVKKIDFFVKGVPFDLKVTYLPEGYLADVRRKDGKRPELTVLRKCARDLGIPFDPEMANNRLLEDLWKKVSDHPAPQCAAIIRELREFREGVVAGFRENPSELIVWLYENQGIRRFDASNRLFLVLVDTEDYFGSWKLKRALPRLRDGIHNYLGQLPARPGREISFQWEGDPYNALSDVVLVTKP